MTQNASKIAWKTREWANESGFSLNYVYELINTHQIKSVRVGGTIRILVSPKDFFDQLAEKQARNKALDLDMAV